jgi:hypothetical protein
MRLQIGPIPEDVGFHPEQSGWRKLKEPSFDILMLLSIPTALLIAAGIFFAWVALARVHGIEDPVQIVLTLGTLLGLIAAFMGLIVGHEVVHLVALPKYGLTSETVVGFWPQKVTPYVSHEGELSRNRYLIVGLMPFLLLSVVPLLVGLLFAWMPLWLVVLSIINGFISAGDIINAILLVSQTPRSAMVRSKGLETWWRPSSKIP